MSKLVVYKASAGSGKTFRLAAEYLKLVLVDPMAYKKILAVTFTNKATGEMKARILGELHKLAKGDPSELAKQVEADTKLPLGTLSERARKVLGLILHDYSRFSVSTIDSFVQRVVQSLLWEIGQEGNFDLELDEMPVLEKAVDDLLDSASENPEMLQWLYRMAHGRVSDGQSWDVRESLVSLGRQLFTESFRTMDQAEVAQFTDRARVEQLQTELDTLCANIVAQLNAIGKRSKDVINSNGLVAGDFMQGERGPFSFFGKLAVLTIKDETLPAANSYVNKVLEDYSGDTWCSGNAKKDPGKRNAIGNLVPTMLHPALVEAVGVINEQMAVWCSARLLLKQLDSLALMADIWNKIRQQAKDEGFLLISDTTMLLREFVKDSDTPFVYEKTGMRFANYMIDEFQDTSNVQWGNFMPLVSNSLAEDSFSLVVGDVKQAIYRWRGGDWRILSQGLAEDLAVFGVNEKSLNHNFRSLREIVNFNNRYFSKVVEFAASRIKRENSALPEELSEMLAAELTKAYAEVTQEPATKDAAAGYVRVDFLPVTGKSNMSEAVAEELPAVVAQLQERGYRPGDIAILVRTNTDGQAAANMLLDYKRNNPDSPHKFDVVSQDALRLSSSPVVRFCVAALALVVNASDGVARGVMLRELAILKSNGNPIVWHSSFTDEPFGVVAGWLANLRTLPVQEALEEIINHFELNSLAGELAFLTELHEQATNFSRKGNPDINRFIQWWEKKGQNLGVSIPEKQSAITILTIHRSKGLQFPVVIIPFFSWAIEHKSGSYLWVSHEQPPFNLIPKYPIKTSKLAETSLFAGQVAEEKLKAMVDTLNMVYVAFTRPERELYIFAPARKQEKINADGKIENASHLLDEVLFAPNSDVMKEITRTLASGEEISSFETGNLDIPTFKRKKEVENYQQMDSYPTGKVPRGIRLNLEATDFFLPEPSAQSAGVGHGKLMHELLATSTHTDMLTDAVDMFVREGKLPATEATLLTESLSDKLAAEPFKEWFSGSYEIKAEATILTPDGRSYRPDRVMIKDGGAVVLDFKFGHEDASHAVQVRSYAAILTQMGYSPVSGYVWYVERDELQKVVG